MSYIEKHVYRTNPDNIKGGYYKADYDDPFKDGDWIEHDTVDKGDMYTVFVDEDKIRITHLISDHRKHIRTGNMHFFFKQGDSYTFSVKTGVPMMYAAYYTKSGKRKMFTTLLELLFPM